MIFQSVVLILAGYLLGSIPTAYIAGKWLKGVDIRRYGSGTVSGSMVWEHISRWILFPVGIFDIAKGAFPAWLGLEIGVGESVAAAAGLAAVVGHNWPIYLSFTGGRGLSPFLGLLLVIFPWGFPWLLAFLAVGSLLGDSAPWALAGIATMPFLVYWADGPRATYWAIGGMLLLTLAKRLEANRRPLQSPRLQVIFLRLFFDRDIPSHRQWIDRTPDEGENEGGHQE